MATKKPATYTTSRVHDKAQSTKTLCHACGKLVKNGGLQKHLKDKHNIDIPRRELA
jgi:hypothetical protein